LRDEIADVHIGIVTTQTILAVVVGNGVRVGGDEVDNAINGGGSPGICTLRLVGILCRRLDWDGEVREEGGVAMGGEGDCVLEGCLWARRVVSWGSEEEEGEDIRLWGYRGAASALSSMRRARSGGRGRISLGLPPSPLVQKYKRARRQID
jgi:hypothetical protein